MLHINQAVLELLEFMEFLKMATVPELPEMRDLKMAANRTVTLPAEVVKGWNVRGTTTIYAFLEGRRLVLVPTTADVRDYLNEHPARN
jgi:hypothetical protein